MSAPQQDRPGQPDPARPTGPMDFWCVDELDSLLADPGDAAQLGQLLAAAGASVKTEPPVGERAALTAYRAAFAAGPLRESRFLAKMSGRVAAAALVGGLVLSGGAAAAATGTLPDPVQKTTEGLLAKVGVHVPGPNKHANEHARQHAKDPAKLKGSKPSGTGNAVSDLAHSTTATGADKGALISGLASGGKSQARQHELPTLSPTPQATKPHHAKSHPRKTSQAARTPLPRATPHTHGSSGTHP